jgi:hypothetical protein
MVSNKKEMVIRLMNYCKTGMESLSEYEKTINYEKPLISSAAGTTISESVRANDPFCQFYSTKTILFFIHLR